VRFKNIRLISGRYGRWIIYLIVFAALFPYLKSYYYSVLPYNGFQLEDALIPAAKIEYDGPPRDGIPASVVHLAGWFVLTLVPISIAYHLAHYLSYLAIAGQYVIPIASDPFGFGWDLFGTKLYLINIGIVTARFVWYTSLIAIIAGHVIAVYLAHRTALRIFPNTQVAVISQLPMLVLMIGYTMISLWVIAQPIIQA